MRGERELALCGDPEYTHHGPSDDKMCSAGVTAVACVRYSHHAGCRITIMEEVSNFVGPNTEALRIDAHRNRKLMIILEANPH